MAKKGKIRGSDSLSLAFLFKEKISFALLLNVMP
jgi:hypothetical protein